MPVIATAIAPSVEEIRAAGKRLAAHVIRTPLVRFDDRRQSNAIYLKLENLQPIGAFKVRSMGNAMLTADRYSLKNGVYTASSGNAGLALAWMADRLGVPARVYVPASAPFGKLARIRHYGASIHSLTDADWWQVIRDCGHADESGMYVDAVRNPAALAGNGTIGLEILEQMPAVDTVIVPFGGGGVACGVGSALAALKPAVRLVVAETTASAPLTAALQAGRPAESAVAPSFISGAGAPSVLDEMWPLVSRLVSATEIVSVAAVEAAVRNLAELSAVVAEGAGAIPLAAALAGNAGRGTTVCVVTGGNIDRHTFGEIMGRPDR